MTELLVLGGGFAGVMAALGAMHENDHHDGDLTVTLVSATPYITIRPRLYEHSPETLRTRLEPTLRPAGINFVEGRVLFVDTVARSVSFENKSLDSDTLAYDKLILATGSELNAPTIPGLAEHAFDIDNYDSAVAFDHHLQQSTTGAQETGTNTFVIVGSGMTGVELAAEMRTRIAHHAGRDIAEQARIILVERSEVLAPEFGPEPRPIIQQALDEAGVEIRLSTTVTKIEHDTVMFDTDERVPCATTVVATGMRANSLTAQISSRTDEAGRLHVDDELHVLGVNDVYAAGDVAHALADDQHYALMSCQHSLTMGKYAGYNASHELLDLPLRPYRQPGYTSTLDLGTFGAVFTEGWDRKLVNHGPEAKKRKRWINEELIYPPVGDRAAVLARGRIAPETGR